MQLAAGLVTLPWCRFPFERKHLTAVCCDCCASASRCGPFLSLLPVRGRSFRLGPFRSGSRPFSRGAPPFFLLLPVRGRFLRAKAILSGFSGSSDRSGDEMHQASRDLSFFFTSRISSFAKCMSGQPASDCVCLSGMHRRRNCCCRHFVAICDSGRRGFRN